MSHARVTRRENALTAVMSSVATLWTAPRVRRPQEGAAMVEYALILGLVVVVGVSTLLLLGGSVSQVITNTAKGFGP